MAGTSHGSATFWYQADALLRKNLILQKRKTKANIMLLAFPILIFAILGGLQYQVKRVSAPVSSVVTPAIRSPQGNPPFLQIPAHEHRAVRTKFLPFADLPHGSCKKTGSCPVSVLVTGNNQSLGESLGGNIFTSSYIPDSSDPLYFLANNVIGSVPGGSEPGDNSEIQPGDYYQIQSQCTPNFTTSNSTMIASVLLQQELKCLEGLHLWRNSSSEINNELLKGYKAGNSKGKINEIMAAYDFSNSSTKGFNVTVWYNSTSKSEGGSPERPWIPRSVNLASNAYLQFLIGPSAKILFEFVKDMPRHESRGMPDVDFTSSLASLLYVWVILQLFPVILTSLVYEKQENLRLMMKMHGLGDGPYWLISYAYFLLLSSVYMLCFVTAGSCLGLRFFTWNDYGIQFVFYFFFINLQISVAFLLAALFSTIKTAAVTSYLMVFSSGLLGAFFFKDFIENSSISRKWILVMELYPGFSLFRGLYEFSQVVNIDVLNPTDVTEGSTGMRWEHLSDRANGMGEILIIMLVEWFLILFIAYYLDQVVRSGSGVKRSPLFFLENFGKRPLSPSVKTSLQSKGSNVFIQMEKEDVAQEREKVEQLLLQSSTSHSIVCYNIRKIYPGRDGNPEKVAVKGLSLALPPGECFGMLGPNGAGKTSFIKMMIGLTEPTSGTAYVEGMDLRTQMDGIYTCMGVCPQYDLLWETLSGREHLLFYGRLKNLKGDALTQAVEESLKTLNLFHGGIADKPCGKYSGGMKRRLSVAISLIGDPKVVYMDEPSTGLDPASRNNLWNVVKQAKQHRAIILTTHSMEEAEYLCDRLGIFVDGGLRCIGNPKELKARYGGTYVFTITTSHDHEEQVESMVRALSPSANKTYHISGTQKFELPKHEVRIADVFQAVEHAKSRFEVQAWGLADTTLEEVFVKVASDDNSFNAFS